MTSGPEFPQPPLELIDKGMDWASARYIESNREAIKVFLKKAFGGGLDIFQTHRINMVRRIADAGGVESFSYVSLLGEMTGGVNAIRCRNGNTIYSSELLSTPVLDRILPLPDDTPPGIKQHYKIDVLYGGDGIGTKSEEAEETNNKLLMAPKFLERFFNPNFFVNEIGVRESVVTTIEDESWGQQRKVELEHYSVFASTWEAKLREEFVSPFENPQAYQAWRDIPPVTVVDMIFTATSPAGEMFSYVGRPAGSIKKGLEAWVKLRRFYDLLCFCHREIVGAELPEKSENLSHPVLGIPSSV